MKIKHTKTTCGYVAPHLEDLMFEIELGFQASLESFTDNGATGEWDLEE